MSVQNILTDITNNTNKVQAEKAQTRMGKMDIDQDAFLQLLMTQLKYQDPLSPMDNSQFVAQQAQFTQISELQKLNKNVVGANQIMQASSLIGKEVTVTDPDNETSEDKTISGVVSEANIGSDGVSLTIGDKQYPISLLREIKNPDQEQTQNQTQTSAEDQTQQRS